MVVNWSPTLVDNIHFLVLPIVVHFTMGSFKFLVPARFLKKYFIAIIFRRCIQVPWLASTATFRPRLNADSMALGNTTCR